MVSATPQSPQSRRSETALAVIDAYNAWDMSKIMAIRASDCITQVLPTSRGYPAMDNDVYNKFFSTYIPYFRGFHLKANDIIEDDRANKVVIWASSTAETDVGPYSNEYILMLHFNEVGDKITKFYEYTDAVSSSNFFPKMNQYIEQKKAAEEAGQS